MTAAPLKGDRAARDTVGYPDRHSKEFDTPVTPVHHVPAGTAAGQLLSWDGSKWVAGTAASTIETTILTLATREGDAEVAASPLRIYNLYGAGRTLTKVFLYANTAPTGADLIVDVKVDGISVFTGPNRPKIVDGANSGNSTTFSDADWPADSYLTWEVAQIGSTTPGADLVVHIVSEKV